VQARMVFEVTAPRQIKREGERYPRFKKKTIELCYGSRGHAETHVSRLQSPSAGVRRSGRAIT